METIDSIAPVVHPEVPQVPPVEQPPIPTFSPEQQVFIDKVLVPRVMGRSAADVRKNLDLARQKIAQMEIDLKAARPDSTESDRLRSELQAAQLEVAAVKATSAEQTKNADIDRAAGKHGFIDTELVRKITADRVLRNPDGSYSVLDEAGNTRVDTNGQPITLDSFYREVADAKPFLVRGQVVSGHDTRSRSVSSTPAAPDWRRYVGPGSSAKLANELAQRNFPLYQDLKRQARAAGVVV
jgi:hypothetical protein